MSIFTQGPTKYPTGSRLRKTEESSMAKNTKKAMRLLTNSQVAFQGVLGNFTVQNVPLSLDKRFF